MPVIVIGDIGRRIAQRAVVFDQPLQRLPRQVQPVPAGVAALQQGHDSQALSVVIEPAERLHDDIQCVLAGVAERRMAQIMGQRQRLGQVLVQPQSASNGAGDLRDLNTVGQPGAVEIALVVDENLCLILEFPKRRAVDDAVAVALPGGSGFRLRLVVQPPARRGNGDRVSGQRGRRKHNHADTPCSFVLQLPEPLQFCYASAYLIGMEQFAVTDRAAVRIAEIVEETNRLPKPHSASPCWRGDAAASSTASNWTRKSA